MEKRGYIHKDWTRPEEGKSKTVKSASDLESHTTRRLSDAVAAKIKKPRKTK